MKNSKAPKRQKIGFTAAHTILKNERHHIDTWLEFTKDMDYRVLLDTGSTDGSWEYLQELAKKDKSLIIEQKTWTPWRFDYARNYNLAMIPKNVSWVFSPDLDEYFSKNTLDQLEHYLGLYPQMTNMSCARLDIYTADVIVGQPRHIGTNKIFKFGDYKWKSRIYEHVSWIHKDRYECEIYNDDVYLIHNQDFWKETRKDLYLKMLTEVYEGPKTEEDYGWCLWFLVSHYFKEQNMEMFIKTGLDYLKYGEEINKVNEVKIMLQRFSESPEVPEMLKYKIKQQLKGENYGNIF